MQIQRPAELVSFFSSRTRFQRTVFTGSSWRAFYQLFWSFYNIFHEKQDQCHHQIIQLSADHQQKAAR
jgi:hypothetical protein